MAECFWNSHRDFIFRYYESEITLMTLIMASLYLFIMAYYQRYFLLEFSSSQKFSSTVRGPVDAVSLEIQQDRLTTWLRLREQSN